MKKITINQTDVKIAINIGVDITNAQSLKIKYIAPDGSRGEFEAIQYNQTAIVYYADDQLDFNLVGYYRLWAYIVHEDGLLSESAHPDILQVVEN